MLLAICTTQVKKRVNKEKNNNNVTTILPQEDANLDPPNSLELKVNVSILWTTSVNADK